MPGAGLKPPEPLSCNDKFKALNKGSHTWVQKKTTCSSTGQAQIGGAFQHDANPEVLFSFALDLYHGILLFFFLLLFLFLLLVLVLLLFYFIVIIIIMIVIIIIIIIIILHKPIARRSHVDLCSLPDTQAQAALPMATWGNVGRCRAWVLLLRNPASLPKNHAFGAPGPIMTSTNRWTFYPQVESDNP